MIDRQDTYESHIEEQIERYGLRNTIDKMVSACLDAFTKDENPSVSIPIQDTNPHKVAIIFGAMKQIVESSNPNLYVRASSWPKKNNDKDNPKYESVIFVSRK